MDRLAERPVLTHAARSIWLSLLATVVVSTAGCGGDDRRGETFLDTSAVAPRDRHVLQLAVDGTSSDHKFRVDIHPSGGGAGLASVFALSAPGEISTLNRRLRCVLVKLPDDLLAERVDGLRMEASPQTDAARTAAKRFLDRNGGQCIKADVKVGG